MICGPINKYKQQNFLSLTVHYFDKFGKLRSTCLGLVEFEEKKTIENIRNKIREKLEEFFENSTKASSIMTNSVSVTDGGNNVKTVFADRFECQCHVMNMIVIHLLEVAKEEYPEIGDSLEALKKLVTYMKRSGHNNKLSKSLKQAVPTRWNGILAMVESYNDVSEEVEKKNIFESKQQTRLYGINDKIQTELIELLQPFETFTNILSQDKQPTFHLISRIQNQIIKHVTRMKERGSIRRFMRDVCRYVNATCIHAQCIIVQRCLFLCKYL